MRSGVKDTAVNIIIVFVILLIISLTVRKIFMTDMYYEEYRVDGDGYTGLSNCLILYSNGNKEVVKVNYETYYLTNKGDIVYGIKEKPYGEVVDVKRNDRELDHYRQRMGKYNRNIIKVEGGYNE